MDHNVLEPDARIESDRSVPLKKKWRPSTAQTLLSEHEKDNKNGSFDCNICLDSAQDPVVTLCGHLFCWPCIYRWLQIQISTKEPNKENCPVCKANISHSTLVPLYGGGSSQTKKNQSGIVIPRRPPPSRLNTASSNPSIRSTNQEYNSNYLNSLPYFPRGYITNTPSYIGTATMTSLLNPTMGIFGEMVFNRMLGSSNSYNGSGNISRPRMRRQEMQVDESLNRVLIFLFWCVILCLLLF